ncbi:DUF6113 family protein [Mycetocola zhadangensis]|uniref:DUF6113 family protein n=1 Tax=Mycetocola zhadangensis TaxID=1164595 RepID=UPI0019C8249D|nr:DUF6113 family protein [Mycetocola zhadangensis]GGE85106.1 hypothetical protein GCM10011313_04470 [Mycetocola zhadangensis]
MSGYDDSQMNDNKFLSTEPHPTGTTSASAAPAAQTQQSSTRSRAISCILALIVGAVFGAVGTVAHQSTLNVGMLRLPLGLPLALLGVAALLLGFRLLLRDRLVVLLAAIGIVAVIALFSLPSPGGAVLIPQGLAGILWTIGPVLIATVVVAWPRLPERAQAPESAVGRA